MPTKLQNLINHIVFVVDRSGSMYGISKETVKTFNDQIAHLAERSKEMDQETRASVYLFNTETECIIYDKDVMRLPDLGPHYDARGGTQLISATLKAIEDLKKTPELYGDHAFLVYVITDGEENITSQTNRLINDLTKKIGALEDNWTVAALVPNSKGAREAEKFGFPMNNIQIWDTTAKGVEKAGNVMRAATESFMKGRASGIRSTKSLFQVNAANLNTAAVKTNLEKLAPNKYGIYAVNVDSDIRTFVESWTGKPYVKGSTYYQLTKTEELQDYKQIAIQDKKSGLVYAGDAARQMLGLPKSLVKIKPGSFGDYNIYVQSTSVNRKLVKGTHALVTF